MKDTADVVIIGAGIQGLSAAYHLNRMGVRDVAVVEMESIGAGSSGRSAAMLTRQVATGPMVKLAQFSFDEYMVFEDELGVSPGYKPTGLLSIGSVSLSDEMRSAAQQRRAMGIPAQILSPYEIRELVPVVNTDDIAVGVLVGDDGTIDPHSIMQGYASNARRLGTVITEGVKATCIRLSGDRLTGVEMTDGFIATGWVVNAAGAQASQVGKWVGLDIPIDNRRRNIYITAPFPQIPDDTPMVHDDDAEWYYRKEGPGVLMGMGIEKTTDVSMSINREFLINVVEYAMHRVPILAEAKIMNGWSGIRSLTPDHSPIVGPVAGLQGYVNLCGWGGLGVTGAPAGGQLVAEHITSHSERFLDVEPFLLSRFQ